MNKMIKGAAVAGLGVALLLGGGGTLAVWNATQKSSAAEIVSGDLDLQADAGEWTSNLSGKVGDIGAYRVIPGETLTYTQKLDVTLVGDELTATLAVTGVDRNGGFLPATVQVDGPVIANAAGEILDTDVLTEDTDGKLTASTTFEFLASTTKQDSTNVTYDFSDIGYLLEQQAPAEG